MKVTHSDFVDCLRWRIICSSSLRCLCWDSCLPSPCYLIQVSRTLHQFWSIPTLPSYFSNHHERKDSLRWLAILLCTCWAKGRELSMSQYFHKNCKYSCTTTSLWCILTRIFRLKTSPTQLIDDAHETISLDAANESYCYFSSKPQEAASHPRLQTPLPIPTTPQRTYLRIRKPLREREPLIRAQSLPAIHRPSSLHELTKDQRPTLYHNILQSYDSHNHNHDSGKPSFSKNSALSPCHVCHKSPRMKQDLSSYTDCMSCRERACYICVRKCDGGFCNGRTICSKCCVEEGEDGSVVCFACLAVRDDVVMEDWGWEFWLAYVMLSELSFYT